MRTFLLPVVGLALFVGTVNAEFGSPAGEKVDTCLKKIQSLAKDRNIAEIKVALSDIDVVLQAESPSVFTCYSWTRFLGHLKSLGQDGLLQTDIEQYIDKVVKLDIESLDAKLEQVSLLQTLLRPNYFLPPTDKDIVSKRAERVSRLMELIMELNERYDPDWDPRDPKNTVVSESKKYIFISYDPGMRPDPEKEPEEAAMYERFSRRMAEKLQKNSEQERLTNFPASFALVHNKKIVEAYSMEPRDDAGLIRLLEKSKYPVEHQINVLAALNIPYKGFRQWESVDGSFKATATFVSLKGDVVTLEQSDGKQTDVKLSLLREVDREYVKQCLEAKPE